MTFSIFPIVAGPFSEGSPFGRPNRRLGLAVFPEWLELLWRSMYLTELGELLFSSPPQDNVTCSGPRLPNPFSEPRHTPLLFFPVGVGKFLGKCFSPNPHRNSFRVRTLLGRLGTSPLAADGSFMVVIRSADVFFPPLA